MNACERILSLLDEYVDGGLPTEEARAIEKHLASCPSCAATLQELHLLLARAASLPQGIEPSRDLWAGIESRIRTSAPPTAVVAPPPAAKRIPYRALAAAAILALVAGAGAILLSLREANRPETPASASSAAAPYVLPAGVLAMEADYGRARAEILAVVEARRPSLSPATRSVVDENLSLIDRALENIREALAKDPGNPELMDLLRGTHRQEQNLLRRAANLPADA